MKKNVFIGLLLGICLQTYSQNSIDSLVIKIFETWGYDITNYQPGTTPIKLDYNDSVFPYGTHLIFVPSPIFVNVSSDTIFKTDSLGIGFVLVKDNQDTVFRNISCFTRSYNLRPIKDTAIRLSDAFAIQVHLLQEGKYDVTLWIDSYNGIPFNDSIKKLSSHTTHFSVAKKNAIENVSETNSLKVFPNPASEQLNVTCEEPMQSLALFNPTGQRVRQMEPCGNEAQIPLSGLPRGLYLLKVETAAGSTVRKVVVE
jgi:hypothetical protein